MSPFFGKVGLNGRLGCAEAQQSMKAAGTMVVAEH